MKLCPWPAEAITSLLQETPRVKPVSTLPPVATLDRVPEISPVINSASLTAATQQLRPTPWVPSSTGASTELIRVLAAFLHGRIMRLKVSETLSPPQSVNGGAPQGSCAGVQMYTVGTDDIDEAMPDPPPLTLAPAPGPDWSFIDHPPQPLDSLTTVGPRTDNTSVASRPADLSLGLFPGSSGVCLGQPSSSVIASVASRPDIPPPGPIPGPSRVHVGQPLGSRPDFPSSGPVPGTSGLQHASVVPLPGDSSPGQSIPSPIFVPSVPGASDVIDAASSNPRTLAPLSTRASDDLPPPVSNVRAFMQLSEDSPTGFNLSNPFFDPGGQDTGVLERWKQEKIDIKKYICLLYTSPSPRDS